jgi:aldose 1-epimerase
MTLITLSNQQLQLTVDPAQGVNVLAGHLFCRGQWLPFMPDVTSGTGELKASSFVLVPYSNRIADGHFTFQGKAYQLANGARHASHGDVRGRPWQVTEQRATALTCAFDSRHFTDVNWPWPFTATLTYALHASTLAAQLSVTNQGETAMPAGLGWHPYYSRTLTRAGEPIHLHFHAPLVYPDANDNRIPSGPAQPLAPNQDFSTERALAPDNFIDACFYGYDGGGTIAWPESGVRLRYQVSAACRHLILFNPAKPYFAAEPVTNANNGVNLLAAGDPTSGIRTLQPGETLTATFEVLAEVA